MNQEWYHNLQINCLSTCEAFSKFCWHQRSNRCFALIHTVWTWPYLELRFEEMQKATEKRRTHEIHLFDEYLINKTTGKKEGGAVINRGF